MRIRANTVRRGMPVLKYVQIVEYYIDDGKKKRRVLKHLGRVLSDQDMEKYRRKFILGRIRENIEKANLRELNILPPKE